MAEVLSRNFCLNKPVGGKVHLIETCIMSDGSEITSLHALNRNIFSERRVEFDMLNEYRKKARSLIRLALRYYLRFEYCFDNWLKGY